MTVNINPITISFKDAQGRCLTQKGSAMSNLNPAAMIAAADSNRRQFVTDYKAGKFTLQEVLDVLQKHGYYHGYEVRNDSLTEEEGRTILQFDFMKELSPYFGVSLHVVFDIEPFQQPSEDTGVLNLEVVNFQDGLGLDSRSWKVIYEQEETFQRDFGRWAISMMDMCQDKFINIMSGIVQ